MDIMDAPSMLEWLSKTEEDQLLVELRYHDGYWQHRVTGLHVGVEIVTSLEPALSSVYLEVYLADWYYEEVPLAFSSAEDYQSFLFDHPTVEMVQEAVLSWDGGEPQVDYPLTFCLQRATLEA